MLKVQFKRFKFTSIHGKLSSGIDSKYLAAHRLEVNVLPWLIVSGSESVIYGNRGIEPAYFNPLMPYHVAEHHLGDKDNNMMSLDMTAFPLKNHKFYFELFIDDVSVLTASDATYSSGAVGVVGYSAGDTRYDDVLLTELQSASTISRVPTTR